MPQQEIETILARQLASYLAMPIFIVDPNGNLAYYNEPAEGILGLRFEETGEMPANEWATIFQPQDDAGNTIAPEGLPLWTALVERRAGQRDFWITGFDGKRRHISVTALPLIGQANRFVGAMAIFWELAA